MKPRPLAPSASSPPTPIPRYQSGITQSTGTIQAMVSFWSPGSAWTYEFRKHWPPPAEQWVQTEKATEKREANSPRVYEVLGTGEETASHSLRSKDSRLQCALDGHRWGHPRCWLINWKPNWLALTDAALYFRHLLSQAPCSWEISKPFQGHQKLCLYLSIYLCYRRKVTFQKNTVKAHIACTLRKVV